MSKVVHAQRYRAATVKVGEHTLRAETFQTVTIPQLVKLAACKDFSRETEEAHARRFVRGWHMRQWLAYPLGSLREPQAAEYLIDFGIAPNEELASMVLATTVALEDEFSRRSVLITHNGNSPLIGWRRAHRISKINDKPSYRMREVPGSPGL